jgi:hypothetical protein
MANRFTVRGGAFKEGSLGSINPEMPAALKRPNFDHREALLHRISLFWHPAANEILGTHR